VKATTIAAKHLVTQVAVERDDDQIASQRIFDQRLVVVGFDAGVAGTDDPVASSIQQLHDRFDHVLVGQEG
jgi:hypothetical protein